MTALNDILTTIRERAPHEDGVNLKIGEEILRDPASVVDVSIKSFANRIGVSEPSVIRYCRSIGTNRSEIRASGLPAGAITAQVAP